MPSFEIPAGIFNSSFCVLLLEMLVKYFQDLRKHQLVFQKMTPDDM